MKTAKYVMPHIEPGMTIMWSPGAGSLFVPGFVTKAGVGSIEVSILRAGATSFVSKQAVRHFTDPGFVKLQDPSKTGCWMHTDGDSLLAAVAAKTLGRVVAKQIHPGLSYLIDSYTPTIDTSKVESSGSDDDPDIHGY